MQIVLVHTECDRAPTTGQALYILVEESKHQVTLLHPVSLSKFTIPAEDYKSGFRGQLWPEASVAVPHGKGPINEMLAQLMEQKSIQYAKQRTQFPHREVRRAIAVLTGRRVEEVPEVKESVPRGFAIKSDKRPGVVDAIYNMLYEGVTLEEAVARLRKQFPERSPEGMKTTVRCQVNRLPKKHNIKLNRTEHKKRGLVFQWADKKPSEKSARA
jgi:hypothetical protein